MRRTTLCPREASRTTQVRVPLLANLCLIQVSAEELPERTLLLSLYDFKRFSKHELVGEVRVPFADLDFTNMIEECRSLQPAANEEVMVSTYFFFCLFTLQTVMQTLCLEGLDDSADKLTF